MTAQEALEIADKANIDNIHTNLTEIMSDIRKAAETGLYCILVETVYPGAAQALQSAGYIVDRTPIGRVAISWQAAYKLVPTPVPV